MADTSELIQTALDTSASSFRRRMAVMDIARAEDSAGLDALIQLLSDPDQYMRREVVSALAKRDEEAVIDPLITALQDDDDTVQRYAADALGERGEVRAVPGLESLADDNSYSVRDAAKRAIEEIQRVQGDASTLDSAPAPPTAATSAPALAPASSVISEPVNAMPETVIEPMATAPPLYVESQEASELTDDVAAEVEVEQEIPLNRETEDVQSAPQIEVAAADQSAAESSQIVEATVVPKTELSVTEQAESLTVEIVDKPARSLSWDRAVRMRVFFGERLPEARQLFEAIEANRNSQRRDERGQHETLMTLGMERADKEDDLDRLQQATEAAEDRLEKLQRESATRLKQKHRLTQEAGNVWNQMSSSFFPERKAEREREISRLDEELEGLRDRIDEVRRELQAIKQQREGLAGPLTELKESAERLTEARDAATLRLAEVEGRLEELILKVIEEADDGTWESAVGRLADLSTHGGFLRSCMNQLHRTIRKQRSERVAAKRSEAALEQAKAAARTGLELFGEAVSHGFQVSTQEKETPVRLSGAIRFQEDHSFFGGYSGASGSARGTGAGHAAYVLDEPTWRPSAELAQQLASLTDAWTVSGEQAARLEIAAGLRAARDREISDFVHFLHTELERDFE